jgi:hypothetical protein
MEDALTVTNSQPAGPGPGVDAGGRPVIDPTANVTAILEAAVKRQDDLREAHEKFTAEMRKQREFYERELRLAEAKRIDAIRAVDVGAVARAAEVSSAQATTLAAQVSVSAETLRTQVAAAASAQAIALAAALEPIRKDIADLRQVQYQNQGQRTQVVEGRASTGAVYAFIGSMVGLIGLAVAVIIAVTR